MIAAFLVVLACSTPTDCSSGLQSFQEQAWYAPSTEGLEDCADLADATIRAIVAARAAGQPSTAQNAYCEVVRIADGPAPASTDYTPQIRPLTF